MIPETIKKKIEAKAVLEYGPYLPHIAEISIMIMGAEIALESTGWVDCKDRLPKEDTASLLYLNGRQFTGYHFCGDWYRLDEFGMGMRMDEPPSHWANLLPPPTSKP